MTLRQGAILAVFGARFLVQTMPRELLKKLRYVH